MSRIVETLEGRTLFSSHLSVDHAYAIAVQSDDLELKAAADSLDNAVLRKADAQRHSGVSDAHARLDDVLIRANNWLSADRAQLRESAGDAVARQSAASQLANHSAQFKAEIGAARAAYRVALTESRSELKAATYAV